MNTDPWEKYIAKHNGNLVDALISIYREQGIVQGLIFAIQNYIPNPLEVIMCDCAKMIAFGPTPDRFVEMLGNHSERYVFVALTPSTNWCRREDGTLRSWREFGNKFESVYPTILISAIESNDLEAIQSLRAEPVLIGSWQVELLLSDCYKCETDAFFFFENDFLRRLHEVEKFKSEEERLAIFLLRKIEYRALLDADLNRELIQKTFGILYGGLFRSPYYLKKLPLLDRLEFYEEKGAQHLLEYLVSHQFDWIPAIYSFMDENPDFEASKRKWDTPAKKAVYLIDLICSMASDTLEEEHPMLIQLLKLLPVKDIVEALKEMKSDFADIVYDIRSDRALIPLLSSKYKSKVFANDLDL